MARRERLRSGGEQRGGGGGELARARSGRGGGCREGG